MHFLTKFLTLVNRKTCQKPICYKSQPFVQLSNCGNEAVKTKQNHARFNGYTSTRTARIIYPPPAPLTLFVLHAARMDYIRLIQAKFPSSFILFSDLNLSLSEMLVRMTITNNGVDTKQNNKHGKKDNITMQSILLY